MKITSLNDLVDRINNDLGDFCEEFAYKRKELAGKNRSPVRTVLFKYDSEKGRDYAINEGGQTEIQYHIYMRDGEVGYGLGFNAQYVPYATNSMPSIEYIKPFADAFLVLLEKNLEKWNEKYHFGWSDEDVDRLKNIKQDDYVFFGRTIDYYNEEIDDDAYQQMLDEIQGIFYDIYQQVFKLKNTHKMIQTTLLNDIKKYSKLLEKKKNIILQGAPGTGKTYNTAMIALDRLGITGVDLSNHGKVMEKYGELKDKQIFFTTFHQSFDYEDFVEGLKPQVIEDGNGKCLGVTYKREDGIFKIACNAAKEKPVVLIIDEINRGNVSKIFGELITLLESDKREGASHPIPVTLPYSKKPFMVPKNLYIIGTMNTTDRSTGTLDYALRRRFAFVTLKSSDKVVAEHYDRIGDAGLKDIAISLFNNVKAFIENPSHMCGDFDIDDLMVGHSYFMADKRDELQLKMEYEVVPLINEYINDGILKVTDKEKKEAFKAWKGLLTIEEWKKQMDSPEESGEGNEE